MKEVKAYLRPDKLEPVIASLEKAGARDMTVIRVEAIGAMAEEEQRRLIRKYHEKYEAISKLEVVCTDEQARRFAVIIREEAVTGMRGDGRIFVSDVDYALDILTGKEGEEAL
jgi:nitrogen regulatory protein P-II 1